jgi:carboxyl-terminal processing protease
MRPTFRRALPVIVSVIVILASLSYGLAFGYTLGKRAVSSDKELATIEQAWQVLHQDYVDPSKVDSAELAQAAVQAFMDKLADPHSVYLTADEYAQISNSLSGQYTGIGSSVAVQNGQITVVSVNPGSPAEQAGLMPGDVILEIDGVSTQGMTVDQTVAKVQGPAGTQVNLLVQHQGESTPVTLTITRASIQPQTVTLEMVGDIAHITISEFSDTTDSQLTPILQQIAANGAKGIIIDLRDNPGGPEQAVVDVASHFVSGTILTVKYNDGSEDVVKSVKQSVTTDLPMVVLVNANSASASEVFTGAMQDYKRATIAGTVTFGKGSVDQFYVLPDGSAIYLTIARWYTPNGHLIEGQGITPDVTLDFSADWVQWAVERLNGVPATIPTT